MSGKGVIRPDACAVLGQWFELDVPKGELNSSFGGLHGLHVKVLCWLRKFSWPPTMYLTRASSAIFWIFKTYLWRLFFSPKIGFSFSSIFFFKFIPRFSFKSFPLVLISWSREQVRTARHHWSSKQEIFRYCTPDCILICPFCDPITVVKTTIILLLKNLYV